MEALVDEVKGLIISDQAIGHNECTQIHHSLSSIQSTQALPIISSQCIIDHQSSLQSARILRDRRRFTARPNGTPFWMSPRLQSWNQSPSSALLAALRDRQLVQDFCTNIIEQLLKSRIAIFWVLKGKDETHSVIDALKSLIHQAVNLTYTSQADSKALLSFQLDRFVHAQLEDHHLDSLVDLLRHLRLVYIAVQLEAIQSSCASQFQSALYELIERLSNHGAKTVVRIIVLTLSPRPLDRGPDVSDVNTPPIAVNVKNDGMEGTAFQIAGLSEQGRSHINNNRRGQQTGAPRFHI